MKVLILLVLVYLAAGFVMVILDFRSRSAPHESPRFIQDRSISTAVVFVLLWPYKLFRKF